MSEQQQTANGGIGFFGVLLIVFITLKLCGVITWSWFWVLAPVWIPFAVLAAVLAVVGFCLLMAYLTGQLR